MRLGYRVEKEDCLMKPGNRSRGKEGHCPIRPGYMIQEKRDLIRLSCA